LLIDFINLNEFILNPQTKEIVTKELKAPGKKVYGSSNTKLETSNPTSFSELRDLLNRIPRQKPANMGLPENRIDLPLLLNLMMAVTTGGKIILSDRLRNYPYRSGTGYIIGGGDDKKIPPITQQVTQIYNMGLKKLQKRGYDLKNKYKEDISSKIKELEIFENSLLQSLTILAKYVEVIDVTNDDARNDQLTQEIMEDAIKDYEKKSKVVPEKQNAIFSMLEKIFGKGKESISFYSPLN
jgi:hypothetical protein